MRERYFYNGERYLNVNNLYRGYDFKELERNLQKNRNHPIFSIMGLYKWENSKDQHTKDVAKLCSKYVVR